ncbi:MAG: tetratricopeptide repeat protein [Bacteroidia bacterium]
MGKIKYLIAAFFLFFVVFSATYCHNSTLSAKDAFLAKIDSAHSYLNINDTVKYAGAQTCRLCHQAIFDSYMHTGMGESYDIATKQKSAAKFGPHVVVYDKFKDFYYHPFWKNDSLYVLEYRLKGHDTVYRHEQQINYIIGSGQHTNSHIYRVNGYLYQAPVTFYTQEGKWDLAPGFSDGFNSRFSREVGLECMSCHNSYPDFTPGSTNKYNNVPNGITCERCHGAGEMHVKAMQLGHRVDTTKAIDYTIVNPAKLPVNLQVDVCERCHLQGNAVLKPGKSFYDFRPGMKLSDIEDVFMPKYTGMEDEYIMASHIARMKMSKCYLNSLNTAAKNSLKPYQSSMTCVTCHNPHVDVRSVNDNTFNTICRNCHGVGDGLTPSRKACTEKLEVREKVNDNCVSCHMPKGKTIDIPHVITTDHYIRIPVKNEDKKKIKEFITLYDVNNDNPSAETRGIAFIQQYAKFESDFPLLLDSAKHYFPDNTPALVKKNFSSLIDIYFYKQDYNHLLYYVGIMQPNYVLDSMLVHKDYANTDAWTAYRIGEAFYQINNARGAEAFYRKAISLAPYVLEFNNKFGAALVMLDKLDEAEKIYDFILTQDPEFVSALTNKGFISLKKGNAGQAKNYYDKALALSPDDKQAMLNMAGWYIYEKQFDKAEESLKQVLKKYPDEEQAKSLLQQIKGMVMVHKKAA